MSFLARPHHPGAGASVIALALLLTGPAVHADLAGARQNLLHGKYEECLREAESASLRGGVGGDEWAILRIRSLLVLGRHEQAVETAADAAKRYPLQPRVFLAASDAFHAAGKTRETIQLLARFRQRLPAIAQEAQAADSLAAMARLYRLLGADPREVLTNCLDPARKFDAKEREVYLATGDLALDKNDFDLAAEAFGEGLKSAPKDPDLLFGMARALAPSDPKTAKAFADAALAENPRHLPALHFQADGLIDKDQASEAEAVLAQALEINPAHPSTWAYRAVLAALRGDAKAEQECRAKALDVWKENPEVDYLIGRKLARHYRFAEAMAAQRSALKFDAEYLPARLELGLDLLRLGAEKQGWQEIDAVHEADPYSVAAFNLVTLRDQIERFSTMEENGIRLRMAPGEARVYGRRAMDLLERAKETLARKYGVTFSGPITVEIFPEQQDFAVRTFGMPGGEGFLGVCFGPVITVCSPAGHLGRANWEAVLWHELCHSVTLAATRNRMPRWLSEGISVYEEREADRRWGQWMNAACRQRILDGKMTPLAALNEAFAGNDILFAYYESSLAVEFLVVNFDHEKLRNVLRDIGRGARVNDALAARMKPLDELQKELEKFARERASALAPELDWKQPDEKDFEAFTADPAKWLEQHPHNYWGLFRQARQLATAGKWSEAQPLLEKLVALYPDNREPGNPYLLLAKTYRHLGRTDLEKRALAKFAELDGGSAEAPSRLMEICEATSDWEGLARHADQMLAINPMLPRAYELLARAQDRLGHRSEAIAAYRTLLALQPADPPQVHYELARLLYAEHDTQAKRHVLQALEETPRFRDAQRLLLKIHDAEKKGGRP